LTHSLAWHGFRARCSRVSPDRRTKRVCKEGTLQIRFSKVGFSLNPRFITLNVLYSGFEAGPLAEQLSVHTPIPIPYKAPFNWTRAGSIVSLIPIITLIFRFIKPALQNRWVWATGTIATSLVMTSGYMFTRIRGAPYTGPNGAWIAQGYQNQYGQEVQVIAMVCTSFRILHIRLVLIIHRWNLGWIFLDVDCRHTAPIVGHPSKNPGIPLDCGKFPCVQHFSIVVPRQKPRLVYVIGKNPLTALTFLLGYPFKLLL
jgi:hypothetical protein